MNFLEYISNLRNERNETIAEIETATRSSHSTVYQWLTGRKNVPPLKRKVISDMLGLPEDELFPNTNK